MYGHLNNLSATNNGLKTLSEDAIERKNAMQTFDRLLSKARRRRMFGGLVGRKSTMSRLADDARHGTPRYEGVRSVSIDQIIGTENRDVEFDGDFLPLEAHVEQRWVSVASAFVRGVVLPPLDLIRVGEDYYIRDGHHRVSVYRTFGVGEVEAEVTTLT